MFDVLLDDVVVRKILAKCANFGFSYENFSGGGGLLFDWTQCV